MAPAAQVLINPYRQHLACKRLVHLDPVHVVEAQPELGEKAIEDGSAFSIAQSIFA